MAPCRKGTCVKAEQQILAVGHKMSSRGKPAGCTSVLLLDRKNVFLRPSARFQKKRLFTGRAPRSIML